MARALQRLPRRSVVTPRCRRRVGGSRAASALCTAVRGIDDVGAESVRGVAREAAMATTTTCGCGPACDPGDTTVAPAVALPIVWQRLVSGGETCPRCGSTQAAVEHAVARLTDVLRPLDIQPTARDGRSTTRTRSIRHRPNPTGSGSRGGRSRNRVGAEVFRKPVLLRLRHQHLPDTRDRRRNLRSRARVTDRQSRPRRRSHPGHGLTLPTSSGSALEQERRDVALTPPLTWASGYSGSVPVLSRSSARRMRCASSGVTADRMSTRCRSASTFRAKCCDR